MRKKLFIRMAVFLFCAAACALLFSACRPTAPNPPLDHPNGGAEMLVPENALVPAPVPETPPFGTRAGESASKNDGPRQNPNDIDLGADSPAEINPRVGTETVRQAALTKGEILDVLCKMDIRVAALNIEIAERSEDGSAAVLKVGGRDVGARGFADALNLADARITDIRAENGAYVISYTVG